MPALTARRAAAYAAILLPALCGGWLTAWIHPDAPPWTWSLTAPGEVEFAVAASWPGVVWADARNDADYRAGHIPGAIRLAEDDWSDGIGRLLAVWNPDAPIVVYCGASSCGASAAVARRLRGEDYGFKRVYVLSGGWNAGTHGR